LDFLHRLPDLAIFQIRKKGSTSRSLFVPKSLPHF